ncbi:hypothetical protein L7F22_029660 [Adiantum nelumboides]|nr:hypothetical protein [Adiantum nelumboides]
MSRPIHGMAALLHPFYKTPELFHERSLLKLKDDYIDMMYDIDDQLEIDAEMINFMNNLGPSFARAMVLRPEATKFSLTWWHNFGRQGLSTLTHMAFIGLLAWCMRAQLERLFLVIYEDPQSSRHFSTREVSLLRANMSLVRAYHDLGTPKQVHY